MASSRHPITYYRIIVAVRRHSRRGSRATTRAVAKHLGMSMGWTAIALACTPGVREVERDRWVVDE